MWKAKVAYYTTFLPIHGQATAKKQTGITEYKMSYQEDTQGKIKRQTSKHAINLAMEGRWQEAADVNRNIIQNFPNDVDAHNRLGKALMELGDYAGARQAYEKALQLDQYNTIAKKNLQRLEHLESTAPAAKSITEKAEPHLFIEEIGKAGVVSLYQIAAAERLIKMMAGDKVVLKPQDSGLLVESLRGEYLGLVPAKYGQRLARLMAGGNRYTAAIVSANENSISVIIREVYQDPGQVNQVSFPSRKLEEIQPFVSDRVFRPEFEEEEIGEEAAVFGEEGEETPEEAIEEVEEDKEWEQEG
jgi:tetratricopeptide (TPR) repeat protein